MELVMNQLQLVLRCYVSAQTMYLSLCLSRWTITTLPMVAAVTSLPFLQLSLWRTWSPTRLIHLSLDKWSVVHSCDCVLCWNVGVVQLNSDVCCAGTAPSTAMPASGLTTGRWTQVLLEQSQFNCSHWDPQLEHNFLQVHGYIGQNRPDPRSAAHCLWLQSSTCRWARGLDSSPRHRLQPRSYPHSDL